MIGGKRKTIGVFINKSDNYFDNTVFHALQDYAKTLNFDLLIFYTVGYRNSINYYDTQECNMFDLAPIEKLDGIIAIPDSYEMLDFRARLSAVLQRATCPVVNIRYHEGESDCVFTDEGKAIRPLLRHLIHEHGLTKVAFLAGYPGHPDSELRLQAYREEMAANGLPIPEDGIFYGTMWYADSDLAYQHYFSDPEKVPEAIVCANDYMAHGLIREVMEHGWRIPQDVIITGFDNIQDISPYSLSLTTISQDYRGMVRCALDQLASRIREREEGAERAPQAKIGLHGNLVLGDTCGCNHHSDDEMLEKARGNVIFTQNMKNREISQTYFAIELNDCNKVTELHDVLLRKLPDWPSQRDFYLCLFETENKKSDFQNYAGEMTDSVRLVTAFRDRQDCGMPMISFPRDQILPSMAERIDEPQVFYIFLLHQGNNTFGYTAMQYTEGEIPSLFYQHWNVIIANALQNMRNQIALRRLYEERKLSSVTDPLTGLYNRRGLEENLLPYWNQYCTSNSQMCFIWIDMDDLKKTNDHYGHAVGDRAIRALTNAFKTYLPEGAIFTRMGGDEFLIVLPDYSKQGGSILVSRAMTDLEALKDKKLPAKVRFSHGIYSISLSDGDTLEDCLRASDDLMYKDKQARKAARK